MKKVLIVSDYLDSIGGIESYIKNLKKVIGNEFEVELFGLKKVNLFKKIFFLIFSNFNFIFAKKFEKKIKNYKPDIIWFHSVSRVLGPKVIKKIERYNGLKIMTYHDLGYFSLFANEIYNEKQISEKFSFIEFLKKSKKGKIFFLYSIYKYFKLKKLKKLLFKNINVHTVPSAFMLKYVKNLGYGINVKVLPNFILKDQIIQNKNTSENKINFIYFGRLDKEKGFGILLYFLGEIANLKFNDKKKFNKITNKIRIFIFGNGKKKKELLTTFTGKNIYNNDISLVKNLEKETNIIDSIKEKNNDKFIYYLGERSYSTIKQFLSFSHYEIAPSLFLETFGLSIAEGAINGVIPIGFYKNNQKNFLLTKYAINHNKPAEDFSKKMFEIIENFDKETYKKDSIKNKKLVQNYVI